MEEKKHLVHLKHFMKDWCMNIEETERKGEPCFRCKQCAFSDKADHICKVKLFITNEVGNVDCYKYYGGMS